MVRIMPLLVLMYALQCFVTVSFGLFGAVSEFIFAIGGCLILMVCGFYVYNLKHKVDFHEEHFEVSFLGAHREIPYQNIFMVEVDGQEQDNFSTLVVTCKDLKQLKFYLIDDAFKIRDFLQDKRKGIPMNSRKAA